MTATTFDTLVFSKKLQTHGFAANQAEGLAESVGAVGTRNPSQFWCIRRAHG